MPPVGGRSPGARAPRSAAPLPAPDRHLERALVGLRLEPGENRRPEAPAGAGRPPRRARAGRLDPGPGDDLAAVDPHLPPSIRPRGRRAGASSRRGRRPSPARSRGRARQTFARRAAASPAGRRARCRAVLYRRAPSRWWARYSRRSARVSIPIGRPARATTTAALPPLSSVNTWSIDSARVHRPERRAHRGSDVLVQRIRVSEDPVEQPALLERADHVRAATRSARCGRPGAGRSSSCCIRSIASPDLLVRLDRDQGGDPRLLDRLKRSTSSTVGICPVPLEEAEVDHVVVVVELGRGRRVPCRARA